MSEFILSGLAVMVLLVGGPDNEKSDKGGLPFSEARCSYDIKGIRTFSGSIKCMRTLPLKKMRGIWSNNLEESILYNSNQALSRVVSERDKVWVDFADSAWKSHKGKHPRRGKYYIEFFGREFQGNGTFGHFGMYRNGVFVERILVIRQLDTSKDGD